MYNAVIAQMLKVSHTQTLQQEWEPTINITPIIFVVGELAYHYVIRIEEFLKSVTSINTVKLSL